MHGNILKDEDRMKSAKGKKPLLKFASGERITPGEAIRAKCYECQAYYEDIVSERDCGVKDCPLYPFHPYSSDRTQNKPSMDMIDRMRKNGVSFGGFGFRKGKETDAQTEKEEDVQEN